MDALTTAIATGIGSYATKVGAARVHADDALAHLQQAMSGDEQALHQALKSAQRTVDTLNDKETSRA